MAVTTIGNNVGLYSSVKVVGTSSTTPSSSTTSSVKAKANAINASTTVKSSATQAKTTASTTVSYSSSSSTAKVSSTTSSAKAVKNTNASGTSSSATVKTSSTTASTTVKSSSTTAVTMSTTSSNTPKTTGQTKQEYEILKKIADITKGIVDGTLDVVKGVQEFATLVGDDIGKCVGYMIEAIGDMNDVNDEELFAGMSYDEIIEYRCEHAINPLCRKLYEKYEDEIDVDDYKYTEDGRPAGLYEYFWNEINLNEDNDLTNERGYANTYFHEVGHCMDDVSDLNGYTSNDMDYDFIDVLREDYENLLLRLQDVYKISKEEAYDKVNEWLDVDQDMKNGVSDILKGLSNGEIEGKWGHSDNYYTDKKIEREAFAHFFEAGMSYKPQKLLYILEVFPNAYDRFNEMIKDEIS